MILNQLNNPCWLVFVGSLRVLYGSFLVDTVVQRLYGSQKNALDIGPVNGPTETLRFRAQAHYKWEISGPIVNHTLLLFPPTSDRTVSKFVPCQNFKKPKVVAYFG